MRIRKSAGAAVACASLLLVAACGSNGDDPASGATDGKNCVPTSPEKIGEWCDDGSPLKVAFVIENTEHVYYHTLGLGAEAAGEEHGMEVEVQGPNQWDASAEAQVINAMIETEPDVLIVSPTSPTALTPQLRAAAKKGIVVLTMVQDTQDPKLRWTNVTADDVAQGKALGQAISENSEAGGKIAVLASAPGPVVEKRRIEGLLAGVEDAGVLEPLSTEYCEGDIGKCAAKVNALLSSNDDLAAVAGVGEPMGVGAGNAVRSSKDAEGVLVAAWDASPAQVRDLKAGNVQFLVVSRPFDIGYQAVTIAYQMMKEGKVTTADIGGVTDPADLPDPVLTGFDLAVKDSALCPPAESEIPCRTVDDPELTKYFYR